jgi:hypothetical protein
MFTTFFPDHTTNYWAAHQQPKEYRMADEDKYEDAEDFAPAINNPGWWPSFRGCHSILMICAGYKPAGGQPKEYTMADKDKHEDAKDFAPTIDNPGWWPSFRGCHSILIICAGHKPAGGKSVDEYQKLDAVDESLARWKASLGIGSASAEEYSGPKVALYHRLVIFIHSFFT